ncbi:hypothetical protein KSW81_004454 [Nannochloris sp. 'desiccata']|nr:hypothetical protein KSW81_004454 [Chlorella desiccata (nom. nud.)]
MLVGQQRALLAAFLRTPRFASNIMPSKRKTSSSPSLPHSTALNGDDTTDAPDIVVEDELKQQSAAPPPPKAKRILSWNVAGLRALLKKAPDTLKSLIDAESPVDCLMLQEHKLQDGQHCIDAAAALAESFPEWSVHWNCSTEKKGYSGTAVLSRTPPIAVSSGIGDKEHDGEGRVLTAEFEKMFVVNVYVPNSGEGLKRLDYRVKEWDVKFSEYLKELECRGKPVILTGDLNCAAQEIDIHSPKTNLRSAGFTQEERDSFAQRFLNNGFIDCFRKQHPGVVGYTYWGYRFNLRAKNKGWRLDYFLVSEKLADDVYDCFHLPQVMGSDHCPLGIVIKI